MLSTIPNFLPGRSQEMSIESYIHASEIAQQLDLFDGVEDFEASWLGTDVSSITDYQSIDDEDCTEHGGHKNRRDLLVRKRRYMS